MKTIFGYAIQHLVSKSGSWQTTEPCGTVVEHKFCVGNATNNGITALRIIIGKHVWYIAKLN